MALIAAISVAFVPSFAGASHNVLEGANADFDYVYMDEDNTYNYSDEADSKDSDPVMVFTDDDGESQYLYMGSKGQFDRIYFHIVQKAAYEHGDEDLEWEYYEDGNWRDLDVNDGAIDGFTNKGTRQVSFDIPDDWDKLTYQSKSAYWVRVSPEAEVIRPAKVEQISTRVYNLELNIEDEDHDEIENLSRSDFSVSGGSDNVIYGFINRGDGEYWLALNAEANDTSYKLTIDDNKYEKESITISTLGTDLDDYDVELEDEHKKSSNNNYNNHYQPIYLSSGDTPFRDLDGYWWAESAIEDLYERGVIQGKSYYYYYPGDSVTRAEFLKMILLGANIDIEDYEDEDEDYRDVSKTHWYYDYVLAGIALDVIDDDKYFNPNSSINRAEAVTMLVRLEDELNDVDLDDETTGFWDVNRWDWFAEYVAYAEDEDVINGYGNGYFGPDNNLNRAEAAVMVDNAYDEWWN